VTPSEAKKLAERLLLEHEVGRRYIPPDLRRLLEFLAARAEELPEDPDYDRDRR
jgi:hypothetical protein